MVPPVDQVTEDGYDLQFGTNMLGHFYLTTLLLPVLLATSTPEEKSRVVTTSSVFHFTGYSVMGSGLNFNTFKDSPKRRATGTSWLYGQSKLVSKLSSTYIHYLNLSGRATWYSPKNSPVDMVTNLSAFPLILVRFLRMLGSPFLTLNPYRKSKNRFTATHESFSSLFPGISHSFSNI